MKYEIMFRDTPHIRCMKYAIMSSDTYIKISTHGWSGKLPTLESVCVFTGQASTLFILQRPQRPEKAVLKCPLGP